MMIVLSQQFCFMYSIGTTILGTGGWGSEYCKPGSTRIGLNEEIRYCTVRSTRYWTFK